ncbi:MAG: transcriptional repressor [Bacteroidales bacterium]|nr:transcriptional repressor [Bacteroidales bacterium]
MAIELRNKLVEKGLKVTPQRLAILEAIIQLHNHPTAEHILEYIRKNHPNIATGTLYKVLDTLSEKGLILKVKTDRDIMRYDAVTESHHHLYCAESDRIEDYFDEDLNHLLDRYFSEKGINGFNIRDIKLQIIGNFEEQKEGI